MCTKHSEEIYCFLHFRPCDNQTKENSTTTKKQTTKRLLKSWAVYCQSTNFITHFRTTAATIILGVCVCVRLQCAFISTKCNSLERTDSAHIQHKLAVECFVCVWLWLFNQLKIIVCFDNFCFYVCTGEREHCDWGTTTTTMRIAVNRICCVRLVQILYNMIRATALLI